MICCTLCKKPIIISREPSPNITFIEKYPYHHECSIIVSYNQTLDESLAKLDGMTVNGQVLKHSPQTMIKQYKPKQRRGSFWSHSILNCEKCHRPKSRHTTQQVKECMNK